MNAIVDSHREDFANLCRRFGVQRLELFGSARSANPESAPRDFDFLVFNPGGYDFGSWMSRVFDLERALSALLGYPVDLVMEKALENRWFRNEEAKTREVIYDASQIAEVA
jgi:predicted nucleotidyltransferase